MVDVIDIALAAVPLVVVSVLLVGLLWPATRAMPIAWLSALVVGFFAWKMPITWLTAATIEGVLTAIQILFIVFGALVLLYTMLRAGAFDVLNSGFASISEDRRVQIVLVAFFLSTFIEGAAGFGAPAAVVAPLLLGLGFPALAAVVAALIGHIIAVTYGAVGTPIIVGIREPMASVSRIRTVIEAEGLTATEFAVNVAAWAATYHLLVGFVMPLFVVGMIVYFFGDQDERSIGPALEVWPLCLFAGLAFSIPYWLSAWYLSAEFPSLVGSMIGAAITIAALRAGYFLPEEEWTFPDQEEWPDHWLGSIQPTDARTVLAGTHDISLLRAWSPYLLLLVFLLVTRVIDPLPALLQGEQVQLFGTQVSLTLGTISTGIGDFTVGLFLFEWSNILGTDLGNGVDFTYVPGFWLLLSAVAAIGLFDMNRRQVSEAWLGATSKLLSPLIALVFVLAMANVMLQSGSHTEGVDSMIVVLGTATANVVGPAYPMVAALIGALGAALVGSNTVSNITFGPFQFVAAERLGLSRELIVGAQAVGGAIGNLVAIHNIVAALATVGLVGEEGRVIRLNLIPLLYYTVFVGLWALLFTYVLFPKVF
ncbi:L-lactate permease [Natronorubrum sp. DTA7]|uniref:L-lactate permease n=1 Tax=Natronorubrum sp. DTA7 TaxID=3447016 RepID=UPI003F82C3A0